ncbi:uncharacterized protein LOC126556817 [Anopheles maculipalpis]|uniref:uncharacterized protein LOC126556817 n=1 Tax=Anopheles maculipalpis TaxID=1496333 RepID=UPI002159812B|nr:uncharacterized protein LOC126556817 [Anopheles maculipalpis]
MAESKQTPLSAPEVSPKRDDGGRDSPQESKPAADTTEDITFKGADRTSCSPPTTTRESVEASGDEKNEENPTIKQEAECTPKSEPEEEESSPQKSGKATHEATSVKAEESSAPEQPKMEATDRVEEKLTQKEEVKTKEPTSPVTMETQQQQQVNDGDVDEDGSDGVALSTDSAGIDAKGAVNSEPKVAGAAAVPKGESRKRSQTDHSRRSRSSSDSSTSSTSNENSTSPEDRNSSSSNSGGSGSSSSSSDSEGASSAKKVKLEPLNEEEEEEALVKTEVAVAEMDAKQRAAAASPSARSVESNMAAEKMEEISGPEEQPNSTEPLDQEEQTSTFLPPASVQSSSPVENVSTQDEEQAPGSEEANRTESLLLPPPPPPPPLPRVDAEISRTVVGKVSIVAPVLERPDSARLTADLQSCQRQLAEVRSKFDVTRKELHATKRKLKRMSVRLGNTTGGAGSVPSGAHTVGSVSPHPLAIGTADEDRNRKWREPMIRAAMKIKTAMGIQAYKSLIKDGELLLPSLRTITRYLESLRKSGSGATAAALANVGPATKGTTTPIEVEDVAEEEEYEDEEEMVMDEDGMVARNADGMLQRRLEQSSGKKKQAKANGGGGGGTGRTIDYNRNEQRRHPSYASHHQQQQHHRHLGPDVQLQEIKTEQDPVSFTASPDINYYQHADDDEEEDEDGYQDPTSLLEECRYEEASGMHLNGGEDAGYHYGQQGQQPQQQQTLSQAQIEFLKSMVGFRKKWTPYELRTCNDIRRIIGSREYESLRRKDGMPLPSVKTLRKYRHAAQLPDDVDIMGRKRKLNEMDDSPTNQSRTVPRYGAGVEPAGGGGTVDNGSGVLFPFGNDTDKELLKPEHDPDGGHFDVSILTLPQISFLQTLTMNTKGFSDYELQRSLELKNELGSGNYETLRKQEFLNIPTLAMLTRYEQDNGLEDLSRLRGRKAPANERKRRKLNEPSIGLAQEQEYQRNREIEEQQAWEQQQQEQEQEHQRQLELYNRLTQADPSRHPLFDSIAGDSSPAEGTDPAITAAALAAAMAAAAAAGLHHTQLDHMNGNTAGGEDSSMSMFEHHSIFDKDTPMFDMTKLSPAHVEFLNTLPENPKRWTQEMINSALDIKNEIGTRDYEILRRQGIPLPAARTLRRHKDIRNKADRALSETGEILPNSGSATPAGIVGGGG